MSDDLVAFLRARVDEDARAALDAGSGEWYEHLDESNLGTYDILHAARHEPALVLREVEAKRAILARYEDTLVRQEDPDYPAGVARDQAREYEDFVLPNLAAVYRDHPDYRQEWAP